MTACSGTNGTGTCITGSIATFSTPNPPAYRTDGDPFGTIVRSLRTADFNVKVTRDESWLWRRRPGVAYLHMNGAAVVALRALYRMSQELLEGAEAQRLKREILARGPRNTQVNTKYMQAEIDFWKVLAGMHGMPAGRVLMWAFALIDLEQGRAT